MGLFYLVRLFLQPMLSLIIFLISTTVPISGIVLGEDCNYLLFKNQVLIMRDFGVREPLLLTGIDNRSWKLLYNDPYDTNGVVGGYCFFVDRNTLYRDEEVILTGFDYNSLDILKAQHSEDMCDPWGSFVDKDATYHYGSHLPPDPMIKDFHK